jgi:hypothetical protein
MYLSPTNSNPARRTMLVKAKSPECLSYSDENVEETRRRPAGIIVFNGTAGGDG